MLYNILDTNLYIFHQEVFPCVFFLLWLAQMISMLIIDRNAELFISDLGQTVSITSQKYLLIRRVKLYMIEAFLGCPQLR